MANDMRFEGKERRMAGIEKCLAEYGIESLEAARAIVNENLGTCDILVNGAGGNNQKAMPTITQFDKRELDGNLPEGTKGVYNIDMDAFESVLNLRAYPLCSKPRVESGILASECASLLSTFFEAKRKNRKSISNGATLCFCS